MTNLPVKTISVVASGTDSTATRDDVRAMHMGKDMPDIGVHWLVGTEGRMYPGLQEGEVGMEGKGVITVAYIGKVRGTRTDDQNAGLAYKIAELQVRYPKADVTGTTVPTPAEPVPMAEPTVPEPPVFTPTVEPVVAPEVTKDV